jgi:spermidine synthase
MMPEQYADTERLEALLSKTDVFGYEETPGGISSVSRSFEAIAIKANGTLVASTSAAAVSERMSAHIPLLLHPEPASLMAVGFGTGAGLAAAQTYPLQGIVCVEGTHAGPRTLRPFASHNRDALGDPRLTMVFTDPWHYLSVNDRSYDVILLESPLPFTRAGSKLLTSGFFELVRSRLEPGGLACQCINTADLSSDMLGVVVRTFTELFPHVSAWWTGRHGVMLLGGMEPNVFISGKVRKRMAEGATRDDLALVNMHEPLGILALYIAGRDELRELGAGMSPNTVLENRLAGEWPRQTLSTARSATFDALQRISAREGSAGAVSMLRPSEGDTGTIEEAGRLLDFCSDARGLYLRSAEAVLSGDLRRGVTLLEEALSICSLNGTLLFPLSDYYMRLSERSLAAGRLGDALESARRAVELLPLSAPTFYNLAYIELQRDPETAIALLGRATELDPDYIPGYLLKARAELAAGKPKDATETVGRVLSVEPFNARAHHLKGLSLLHREQYEAGRLELESALEGRPGDPDILEALAFGWLLEGRFERSQDVYRQVLAIDPTRLGALNNYATALAEQGKYEEAVEIWTRALALSPGNQDIIANIQDARQNMRR